MLDDSSPPSNSEEFAEALGTSSTRSVARRLIRRKREASQSQRSLTPASPIEVTLPPDQNKTELKKSLKRVRFRSRSRSVDSAAMDTDYRAFLNSLPPHMRLPTSAEVRKIQNSKTKQSKLSDFRYAPSTRTC